MDLVLSLSVFLVLPLGFLLLFLALATERGRARPFLYGAFGLHVAVIGGTVAVALYDDRRVDDAWQWVVLVTVVLTVVVVPAALMALGGAHAQKVVRPGVIARWWAPAMLPLWMWRGVIVALLGVVVGYFGLVVGFRVLQWFDAAG